jgi:D-tyrosyl-tRNA(Tyr) deacylase
VIALIQRVSQARVVVNDSVIGEIASGVLALIGVEKGDAEVQAGRLLDRLLGYRIFPDDEGKMNLSLTDVGGGLLLVPQFTLAADTHKGTRPSFSSAAPPGDGQRLFDHFVSLARASHPIVATGRFGADMKVHLVNDGPVTFWLQAKPEAGKAPT